MFRIQYSSWHCQQIFLNLFMNQFMFLYSNWILNLLFSHPHISQLRHLNLMLDHLNFISINYLNLKQLLEVKSNLKLQQLNSNQNQHSFWSLHLGCLQDLKHYLFCSCLYLHFRYLDSILIFHIGLYWHLAYYLKEYLFMFYYSSLLRDQFRQMIANYN